MALGGPNKRTDYHINHTEEYFYQFKGDMLLKTVQNGEFIDIPIKEGEMFVLPRSIPHNPCRFANTIGLVIETKRPQGVLDTMRWYCKQCKAIVYEESFYCVDLGVQLKPVIAKYTDNQDLRTCKSCGFINSPVHDWD
jgi:3-hydroxyanthranilate 3,4-dioxygenase